VPNWPRATLDCALAPTRQRRTSRISARISTRASLGRQQRNSDVQQAVERLDGIAQDLELVQERARLLQEEIAGRLGEATNRNLYLLSVMTTVLLADQFNHRLFA